MAANEDMDLLMQIRLEMLKEVNGLPSDYEFADTLISESIQYFRSSNQTTVLAVRENSEVIGCATLCYTEMLPTFSHPTGKRAHLMNVYTNSLCWGQGIASRMVETLINEARKREITEISLDATESGRPLYHKLGFTESDECMVLNLQNI